MARGSEQTVPTQDKKTKVTKNGIKQLTALYRFFKPFQTTFIFGLIALFFSSSIILVFPKLVGDMIDVALQEQVDVDNPSYFTQFSITQIALILVGVLAVQSLFSFMRVWLFAKVSENALSNMREELYRSVLSIKMKFFDERRVGDLISVITADVGVLNNMFSVTLAELFRQVLTLIVGVVVLFVMTPQLTFFMLATLPPMIIAAIFFGRYLKKVSKQRQEELGKSNVIVDETLQAISTVKAFANEFYEVQRYKTNLTSVVQMSLKAAFVRGIFISFIIFVFMGGIVSVLWYGTVLVENKEITVGELTSFLFFSAFIGGSIAGLGNMYSNLQQALGATERITEILEEEVESTEISQQTSNYQRLEGNIQIQDIEFSYPTRKDVTVLNNISLEVKSGERIALVGSSGAGKSTITQLLMRFYEVDKGAILIDGKSIDEYQLNEFRNDFAIVPQEVILFGGSIRENIAYGHPGASDEEIATAAKKANAYNFITKFPEGMSTLVGERGVKLSGGQRQRIAIARAILKNPKILILDEATSALDAESERLVQEALDVLMENRTTIVIAHRLATVRKVDCIHVLDQGKIVESGTHDQLVNQENGVYNHLMKLQFETV